MTYVWMLSRRGALRTRVTALINVLGAWARYVVLTPLALIAPGRWAARRRSARWWATLHGAGATGRRP
jgi:hypothetical protein